MQRVYLQGWAGCKKHHPRVVDTGTGSAGTAEGTGLATPQTEQCTETGTAEGTGLATPQTEQSTETGTAEGTGLATPQTEN